MSEISFFKSVYDKTPSHSSSIEELLNQIQFGEWSKLIEKIRNTSHKVMKKDLKMSLPMVTVSGTFSERVKSGLTEHSGYICIDFDNIENIEEAKQKMCSDSFTYACFKSVSGAGFAVIVKIDGSRHSDAFLALENYYINTYHLIPDKACKDVTRARFVSYDKEIYLNPKSKTFTKYLPKKKKEDAIKPVIFQKSDISETVERIVEAQADITDGIYQQWLSIGFALASELGENGREYYHAISQFSEKYDHEVCDKQYDYCIKSDNSGVTISSFFHFAKTKGIEIVSEETKLIATVAKQSKRQKRDKESAIRTLVEMDGIPKERAEPVVNQVYRMNIDLRDESELPVTEQLEIYLKSNYSLRRNEITRQIEHAGEVLTAYEINSIWNESKKAVSEKISYLACEKMLMSNIVPIYNPLTEFIDKNRDKISDGNISKLVKCIDTDTGFSDSGGFDPFYVERFLTCWLVGIIASIYGNYSPLLLVLTGAGNSGKTEFFRRLLPKGIMKYYAESKLDQGKDDYILMCQKLIIMDDEFSGKSKTDMKKLKDITSKDVFNLREPYGRSNVDLKRLAVLCGTSNEKSLLSDPTGNRRIIPIHVLSLDHDLYNSIDKTALFMEAVKLYEDGYDWQLKKKDIDLLYQNTSEFEYVIIENELICKYYELPSDDEFSDEKIKKVTTTDIKVFLEKQTQQRLSAYRLGQEMTRLGFIKKTDNSDEKRSKKWHVIFSDTEKTLSEKLRGN